MTIGGSLYAFRGSYEGGAQQYRTVEMYDQGRNEWSILDDELINQWWPSTVVL